MSNKHSFKISDLKALHPIFESFAGRSLLISEFIELLDLINSFKADEPETKEEPTPNTEPVPEK